MFVYTDLKEKLVAEVQRLTLLQQCQQSHRGAWLFHHPSTKWLQIKITSREPYGKYNNIGGIIHLSVLCEYAEEILLDVVYNVLIHTWMEVRIHKVHAYIYNTYQNSAKLILLLDIFFFKSL